VSAGDIGTTTICFGGTSRDVRGARPVAADRSPPLSSGGARSGRTLARRP
jgi:hypothetical protein